MKNVLTSPEEVTSKWLTEALRKNGLLERGKVINVQNKLTKTLPLSVVSRLAVTYSSDISAPSQLFLKISRNELSQANGKEVEFYHTLAREMDASPLIQCYDAA